MSDKKQKSNEWKFVLLTFFCVIFIAPLFSIFFLYMINNIMLNNSTSFIQTFSEYKEEFAIITVSLYALSFYLLTNWFNYKKPKKSTALASSSWASEDEQKERFGLAPIDSSKKLPFGGAPINLIDDEHLLYLKDSMHDICVGTTRSGKSRKVVRQLVMLASMADESMIFNDPKKEMYQDFHIYLEKKNYDVYCLDLRNMQYSNCWNPLDTIIQAVKQNDIDNADQYAQDMVTALVVDTGKSEPIWIEGQKGLIKGLILSNAQANISDNKKNLYSAYKSLAELGEEKSFNGDSKNKKMPLSVYFDSLAETDIARTAYTAIKNSPEKTRGGFMATALATLQTFSSIKLMKVLGSSDFSFNEFANGKKALFVVNPDEKKTYNSVAAICYSQAYQSLAFVANTLPDRKLTKRVHMIFDEFGNMPPIDAMQTKLTVALSREIVYHLYVQDFAQLDDIYGAEVSKVIRGNCNVWYFIASSDLGTCEEISKRIGNETIWVDSHSGNYNNNANTTGGGLSYQQQTRALKDPNELLQSDNRDGHNIIVSCLYTKPCNVYLPDCSKYKWYEELIHDEVEVEREHSELTYAIPRYIEIHDNEIIGKMNRSNIPLRLQNMNEESMFEKEFSFGMYNPSPSPKESELFWYWSMRDDLGESVRNHICNYIKNNDFTKNRKEIKKYMDSKEFLTFLNSIDVSESTIEKNANSFKENTSIFSFANEQPRFKFTDNKETPMPDVDDTLKKLSDAFGNFKSIKK